MPSTTPPEEPLRHWRTEAVDVPPARGPAAPVDLALAVEELNLVDQVPVDLFTETSPAHLRWRDA